MKAEFAKFPEHKQKGGNNKDNNMYIKEYENMRVDSRDRKVALDVSDNGRCWWVYDYIIRTTIRRKEV